MTLRIFYQMELLTMCFRALIFLLLIININAYAVNLPQASSYVGYSGIASGVASNNGSAAPVIPLASVTTTVSQTIGGGAGSTSSNNYYGLYAADGQPYKVLGGTYYVTDIWVLTSTANDPLLIGEGTLGVSAEPTGTKPTGWHSKYTSSNAAGAGISLDSVFKGSTTANSWNHFSFPGITFSPNSFPSFFVGSSGGEYKVIMSGFIQ